MLRGINRMRAGCNPLDSAFLKQQFFQLSDQFGFENVLDRIRTLVDSSRSNIRMSDQIQLPKSMLMNQSGCFNQPRTGQTQFLITVAKDEPLSATSFDLFQKSVRRPASQSLQFGKGDSSFGAARFLQLKHPAKQMLVINAAIQITPAKSSHNHTTFRPKHHADKKQRATDQNNHGAGGKVAKQRTHRGPKKTACSADSC